MKHIFRQLGIAVALTILIVSAQAYSQPHSYDISELELNSLIETLSDEQNSLDTLHSVTEINHYLSLFQPLEQIVLKHLWLKQLSYQQVISEHHLNWVRSLTSGSGMLATQLSDHPQKKIVLVNIARQASAVLRINHLKQQVEKIQQQWLSGEFTWIEWLGGEPENYAALVNWLTMQDNDIDSIKRSFIQNSTAAQWPSNQILAIFIGKSPSADVFSLLWQRDVDEFTYQTIHDLAKFHDSQLVVDQLVTAMQIKQLTSQALLSLATHYPLDETAQKTIETALEKPQQQWFALMALDKMDAPEFKRDMLLKINQQQTRFAKSATKMLERKRAESEEQQ